MSGFGRHSHRTRLLHMEPCLWWNEHCARNPEVWLPTPSPQLALWPWVKWLSEATRSLAVNLVLYMPFLYDSGAVRFSQTALHTCKVVWSLAVDVQFFGGAHVLCKGYFSSLFPRPHFCFRTSSCSSSHSVCVLFLFCVWSWPFSPIRFTRQVGENYFGISSCVLFIRCRQCLDMWQVFNSNGSIEQILKTVSFTLVSALGFQ